MNTGNDSNPLLDLGALQEPVDPRVAERRARDAADRAIRELTVRVASVQADASVERERLLAERTRLEVELARAHARRPRRWPLWLAIAACAAWAAASTAWASGRIDESRRQSARTIAALAQRLDDQVAAATRRADAALQAAERAAEQARGYGAASGPASAGSGVSHAASPPPASSR